MRRKLKSTWDRKDEKGLKVAVNLRKPGLNRERSLSNSEISLKISHRLLNAFFFAKKEKLLNT